MTENLSKEWPSTCAPRVYPRVRGGTFIDYSAASGAELRKALAQHAELFEQAVAAATERIAS